MISIKKIPYNYQTLSIKISHAEILRKINRRHEALIVVNDLLPTNWKLPNYKDDNYVGLLTLKAYLDFETNNLIKTRWIISELYYNTDKKIHTLQEF